MRLVVSLECRFDRTPDGAVWTQINYEHSFWTRYLTVFDEVAVLARVRDVESVPTGWLRSDGEGVLFTPVPHYHGPSQFALQYLGVRRGLRRAIRPRDAVLMRVPSFLAMVAFPFLRRSRHPYSLEVVGDPYDTFGPGAVRHPLRALLRWWLPHQVRRQCKAACGVGYVTERALQRRYPAGPHAHATHYSSIELQPSHLIADSRTSFGGSNGFTIVTIGSLDQMYKAPDVLIDAVAECARGELDVRLKLVGDGRHRGELEARAQERGIGERVRFLGRLTSGDAVRRELDTADLFVLPSRTEGLPRTVIEAMARGLPCLGSAVGGIPELLPAEHLVPPGDASALANAIRSVLSGPERMARMSARNLAKAGEYLEENLASRRTAHYRHLRSVTEAWLRGGSVSPWVSL